MRDYDSVTDALARITRGKCHRGPLANAATRGRVQWARGNTGVATRGVATAAGVFDQVATDSEGRRIKRAGLQRLSYPVVCPRKDSNPWGSVLRVICVTNALLTIEQSYDRAAGVQVCSTRAIARWLRKSLFPRREQDSRTKNSRRNAAWHEHSGRSVAHAVVVADDCRGATTTTTCPPGPHLILPRYF